MTTRVVTSGPVDGVARVTLDGPPLNLNTLESIARLHRAFEALDADDQVGCVVMAASTNRVFCAGSDVKEFPSVRDEVVERKLRAENQAFRRIETCRAPVIAAIEGIALGGGCELAMACDLRIAGESASFGFPEIRLGVFPGSGGLYRLPRLVGQARATELMLLGDSIEAEEALRIGLVNRVVPAGHALDASLALAARIAQAPREAAFAIKTGVREAFRGFEEAQAITLALSEKVFRSADCAEGVRAFFEKRPPRFRKTP